LRAFSAASAASLDIGPRGPAALSIKADDLRCASPDFHLLKSDIGATVPGSVTRRNVLRSNRSESPLPSRHRHLILARNVLLSLRAAGIKPTGRESSTDCTQSLQAVHPIRANAGRSSGCPRWGVRWALRARFQAASTAPAPPVALSSASLQTMPDAPSRWPGTCITGR